MKAGLRSIWLCGFLLISISLYATQLLPSLREEVELTQDRDGDASSPGPSVTIFSSPRPFFGVVGDRQLLAVRSWLALSPEVQVVLFAQNASMRSPIRNLGSRVSIETAIDFTFLDTPFFHAMVARARASGSSISVLIDSETLLLPSFISALHYVYTLDHNWLFVAKPRHLSHLKFHLDNLGRQWVWTTGQKITTEKLEEFLVHNWQESNYSGRWLWAWNTGNLPLHAGVLPSFLYGKGYYNEWLMHEALSTELRFVFDGTDVASAFYPENFGSEHSQSPIDSEVVPHNRQWESEANAYLAAAYGSFYSNMSKVSYNMPKLIRCGAQFMISNASMCIPSVHQKPPFLKANRMLGIWKDTFVSLQSKGKGYISCIEKCNSASSQLDVSTIQKPESKLSVPSLPFSLKELLETVADDEKTVVLAVAGNNYRDMLMSWVCRLRRISVSNFILCALDDEVYRFSFLQGLPVFKAALSHLDISFDNCHFGTKCFQRVTKVKSRIVLKILRMGYNVLMSDVDVYWFKNPLSYLHAYGPAVLVAQSDEFNETVPINLPRRLNSGFYYVHSDPATILAMEKVVTHASTSAMSEQPSFYDVLCGVGGKNRIGDNKCHEPLTNVTVHFLDRNLFPNGAFQNLWRKKNVTAACMRRGCITLHNNWISGRKKKLQRHIASGLWEYDVVSRLCLQSWQDQKLHSYV
ncbi:beta-arabinofuranosyltransferase RAY1 isoform X1 [Nymphaea colorata]|nr:beta-arabinofuranosyltransferase RAY1 isoform X1 [Nymphaea colorata]